MRKEIFMPMELVDVEPVKVKKITDEQRTLLCRSSLLNPFEYYQSITRVRQNLEQQCFKQDSVVAAWDFIIDNNMHRVPARILPMPDIVYTNKYRVTHQQCRTPGVWSAGKTLIVYHHHLFHRQYNLHKHPFQMNHYQQIS
jgi:hypothetical protein